MKYKIPKKEIICNLIKYKGGIINAHLFLSPGISHTHLIATNSKKEEVVLYIKKEMHKMVDNIRFVSMKRED